MIHIPVSEIIEGKAEEIFAILRDYDNYENWWVIPVKRTGENPHSVELSPAPFTTVRWKEDSFILNKELRFEYVKGPFRGVGVWKIEPINDSKKVKLTYTINLKPVNFFVGLAAGTPFFKMKHTKDIRDIIRKIEAVCRHPG